MATITALSLPEQPQHDSNQMIEAAMRETDSLGFDIHTSYDSQSHPHLFNGNSNNNNTNNNSSISMFLSSSSSINSPLSAGLRRGENRGGGEAALSAFYPLNRDHLQEEHGSLSQSPFKALDLFADNDIDFSLSDPSASSRSIDTTVDSSICSTSSSTTFQADARLGFAASDVPGAPADAKKDAVMAMSATDVKDIAFLKDLDTNPGSYQHASSNLAVSVAAMAISPTPSCTSSPASSIASSPSSPTYDDVVLPVVACASCKRSHIKCDHARPCLNCQKHPSKALTCRDAVPKPRGRPKGGSKIAAEAMMVKRQQQQGAFHPFPGNPLQYPQHVQQQPQQFHRQRAMSFPHILPPHQPVPYFLQQQQHHQQILQQQQQQIQQHQHQQHAMSHPQIPTIPQAEHQAFQSAQDRGAIPTSRTELHAPHHHLASPSAWASQTTGVMSLPVPNDPSSLTTISTHTPESNVLQHPPMLTTPSIGVSIHTLDAHELQKLHLHRQQFRQHTQQQQKNQQQRQQPHPHNQARRNPHEIGMTRSMSDHTGPGNQGRPFYFQSRQQQAWPVQHNALALSIPSPMVMTSSASSPASPASMLPPPPPSISSASPSCSSSMQQQYSPAKPRSMRSRSESTELASNRMAMLLLQQQHEIQFEMQLQHQRQQQQLQRFQNEQELACLNMQEQKFQQQQHHHQGRRHLSLSQPIPSHPMLLNELASPALPSSMDAVNLDRSAQLQQQQQQQQQQSHIQFHRRSSLQTGFSSPSPSTGVSPLTASNSSVSLSALNDEEMVGLDE